MMKKPLFLLMLPLAAALLCSCGERGSATPQAAKELADMVKVDIPRLLEEELTSEEEVQAMLEVIAAFRDSANPQLTVGRSNLHILHLACFFKRAELARCLLLDGADPNVNTRIYDANNVPEPGDTPLTYAISQFMDGYSSADIIALVDLLLESGADIERRGPFHMRALDVAGLPSGSEAVFEHVLALTPKPEAGWTRPDGSFTPTHMWPAYNSWPTVLRRMLENGYDAKATVGVNKTPLLQVAARPARNWTPQAQECVELLLEHGEDINALDNKGRNVLFYVASRLMGFAPNEIDESNIVAQLCFLLERGARADIASTKDADYPGFTAYDFLSMRPELLAYLRDEKGFAEQLQATPLNIPDGAGSLMAALCKASQTGVDPLEFTPYFERMARMFYPNEEMLCNELFPTALEVAMGYMAAINPEVANKLLNSLAYWTPQHDWKKEDPFFDTLLYCVVQIPAYELECHHVVDAVDGLAAAGYLDAAATVMELLSRCSTGEEAWKKYENDSRIELVSGALCAQLLAQGLPLPKDGEVQAWLLENNREADNEVLKKALLLTSFDLLWMGRLSAEEQGEMLRLMAEVGAPKAAAHYKRIIPALQDPEALDQLTQDDKSWQYELEAAMARFFLANKEAFSPTPAP